MPANGDAENGATAATDDAIARAVGSACAYLQWQQARDGHFREYSLPVGPSDQWVTALAGLALADGGATAAAERAAAWLTRARAYAAGWGYNGRTGPDADSTAHALLLLRALGHPIRSADVDWLLALRRYDGGFATYDHQDGWGQSHVDVTPLVYFALPWEAQIAYGDELADWTATQRDRDGWWPAYWWRGTRYSTYWNLRLLYAVGRADATPPPRLPLAPVADEPSWFALAHLIGVLCLVGGAPATTRALLARLLSAQNADGSWSGSDDLRVTDPRRLRAGDVSELADDRSTRHVDGKGILTTAHVVRLLTWIARQTKSPGTDRR